MAGRPGTTGSAWKFDSCSATASTPQMCSVVGAICSASKPAKMSVAQPCAFSTLAGISRTISARTASGSTGSGRGGGFAHPARTMAAMASAKEPGRRASTREPARRASVTQQLAFLAPRRNDCRVGRFRMTTHRHAEPHLRGD